MSPRQRRYTRFAAGGVLLVALPVGFWLVSARAGASAGGGWAQVRREDLVIGRAGLRHPVVDAGGEHRPAADPGHQGLQDLLHGP